MSDLANQVFDLIEQDDDFAQRFNETKTVEDVIALLKEKGIEATAEDLQGLGKRDGELSDEELDAVAGGKVCVCVAGGGGKAGKNDKVCACVLDGFGFGYDTYQGQHGLYPRCMCEVGGGGESFD